jgi:hypothetical protein
MALTLTLALFTYPNVSKRRTYNVQLRDLENSCPVKHHVKGMSFLFFANLLFVKSCTKFETYSKTLRVLYASLLVV